MMAAIGEIKSLDEPQLGQKYYVSHTQNLKVRVALRTKVTLFHLDTYYIAVGDIDTDKIANILGISRENIKSEESLRTWLALPHRYRVEVAIAISKIR